MPERAEQWAALAGALAVPIATFGALGGRSADSWRERGVSLVIDPFTPQVLALKAVKDAYERFFNDGNTGVSSADVFDVYNQLDEIAGFAELYAIEDQTTEKPS